MPAPAHQPPPTLQRLATALVVDDDAMLRDVARRVLEGLGWTVVVAVDGADALQVAGQLPALRVVVTDLQMPRMRGDDLARRLLGDRPTLAVVIMSAAIDTLRPWDDRMRLLAKPFTAEQLDGALRELAAAP